MNKTIIIGITGLIASGKSTVTEIFKEKNAEIFNSDAYVAKLMQNPSVIKQIAQKFPNSLVNNAIDKKPLKQELFKDYFVNIKILENILHPLVRSEILQLIETTKAKILVLEVPLLFEAKLEELCDYVILLQASKEVRIKRAMQRANSNMQELTQIMYKQEHYDVGFDSKLQKADLVINTEKDLAQTKKILAEFLNKILS